jgi:hypothetical protein
VQAYGRLSAVDLKGCAKAMVETRPPLLVFWPDSGYIGLGLAGSAKPQGLGFAFQYAVSGDTLTLSDSEGRTAVFRRAAEVPASEDCTALEPLATYPVYLPVQVTSSSNLLSDGSQLWVVGTDHNAYPIDPASGSVGGGQTLTASSYYHAVTMQGSDFWAHCRCGNNEDIERVGLGGAVADTIDTNADLGNAISIRAGSWDGNRLWLWGYSYDRGRNELLTIDSDVEPDGLDASYVFDTWTLRQMAFNGAELWGLFRFAGWQLAVIDPAAGRVVRSYTLPQLEWEEGYLGLASLGGRLYLLAETNSGYALYAFQP